jgi:N-acetylglutamate synthase-like GNAT family acetyltransferase
MMKSASHTTLPTDPIPGRKIAPAKIHGTIKLRGADPSDLHSINSLIAAAIGTWRLADRVKRISLPLYRYHAHDLQDMQIVVAHCGDGEILGSAALEQAYTSNMFDGLPTSLLHGIYVAPNLHRNGVGSRLLEKIETLARYQGIEALLVKARPEAISFFSARGFGKLSTRDDREEYPHQFYKLL